MYGDSELAYREIIRLLAERRAKAEVVRQARATRSARVRPSLSVRLRRLLRRWPVVTA